MSKLDELLSARDILSIKADEIKAKIEAIDGDIRRLCTNDSAIKEDMLNRRRQAAELIRATAWCKHDVIRQVEVR